MYQTLMISHLQQKHGQQQLVNVQIWAEMEN